MTSKNRTKNNRTRVFVFIILGMVSLYAGAYVVAYAIQFPEFRADYWFYVGLGVSVPLAVLSIFQVKRITRTRFSRESSFFVLLVISLSSVTYILTHLILRIKIDFDLITTFAVFLSVPLSCAIAGRSKKQIIGSLKKLGLDNGTTLTVVFILSLMPIVRLPYVVIPMTGTIGNPDQIRQELNVHFRSTGKTSLVNGSIADSGFIAEIPVFGNQTFRAEDISELIQGGADADRAINLHFHISNFTGDFEMIENFELEIHSPAIQTRSVLKISNGLVTVDESLVYFSRYDVLLLSVTCSGAGTLKTSSILHMSLSISFEEIQMQTISLAFEAVN